MIKDYLIVQHGDGLDRLDRMLVLRLDRMLVLNHGEPSALARLVPAEADRADVASHGEQLPKPLLVGVVRQIRRKDGGRELAIDAERSEEVDVEAVRLREDDVVVGARGHGTAAVRPAVVA